MAFFWYSITGGNEDWKLVTSDQRANIIATVAPAFTTVLDASAAPEESWEREDFLKLRYSGPLYFDWDSEDIALSIAGFQSFLAKLETEHEFDAEQARLFATGGRGFHMEIPMPVFAPTVRGGAVTQLPLIYREMAMNLHVDTLDMRVYSARRGRMWRTPNVQRTNGLYKVPITLAEARAMTPEMYAELCAEPRYYRGKAEDLSDAAWLMDQRGALMPPIPPETNVGLQALFAACKSRVEGVVRRNLKAKDDRAQLAKFSGTVPVSVKEILNGQCLAEAAGFNDIALQFAILGNAFNMSESEFIDACAGVIKNHSGDGSRYSTPRRRSDALRERYAYVQSSNVYTFSLRALQGVLDARSLPGDLFPDGKDAGQSMAPNLSQDKMDAGEVEDNSPDDETSASRRSALHENHGNIQFTNYGVMGRVGAGGEGKLTLWSTAVFANPIALRSATSDEVMGYEVNLGVARNDGRVKFLPKTLRLDAEAFTSRLSLDRLLAGHGTYYIGPDSMAALLRDRLVSTADHHGNTRYVLNREGMDIVTPPPSAELGGKTQLAWVTQDRVLLADEFAGDHDTPSPYVFRPKMEGASRLHLDVHRFDPPKEGDEEFLKFMEQLVKINEPAVVGSLLGWFVSCYHRQLHHRTHNEFPLVWLYGPAGSGKSTTPKALFHLFTSAPPSSWSSLQRGVTNYAWQVMMSQSVTMPLVVDEFKEGDFLPQRYGEIMADFRAAYNSGAMMRGGIATGAAKSDYRQVHDVERTSPLIIISESFTHETATRERSIPVSVSPREVNPAAWEYINDRGRLKYMTQIGALLMRRTLMIDLNEFDEKWKAYRDESQKRLGNQPPRVVANYAVVAMGLDFLKESLLEGVGLDMSQELGTLREAVWASATHRNVVAPIRSEANRVLQDIAYLTHESDAADMYALREGHEYAFVNGELHVDMYLLGLRYFGAAMQRRMPTFFKNVETLVAGLARAPEVINDNCTHSPLHTYAGARVFSFDPRVMAENGIRPWKGQPDL